MANVIKIQSKAKKGFALGTVQHIPVLYLSAEDLPVFRNRIVLKLKEELSYIADEIGQEVPATHTIAIVPIISGQSPIIRIPQADCIPLKLDANPSIFFNNKEIESLCELCTRHVEGKLCPDYSPESNLACLNIMVDNKRVEWLDLDSWGNIVYHAE